MEKVAQEKSFLNLSDALQYMEDVIWDWGSSGWAIDEGTSLRFVNLQWQVFIALRKSNG